jgi:hypothetical protein
MTRRFSSRAEFLYQHFLAAGAEAASPGAEDTLGLDSVRKGLLIIGQESRFDLFLLILRNSEQLSLEDLAEAVQLGKEKVQYHLYYMLSNGIILAGNDDGRTVFRPNPVFMKQACALFTAG